MNVLGEEQGGAGVAEGVEAETGQVGAVADVVGVGGEGGGLEAIATEGLEEIGDVGGAQDADVVAAGLRRVDERGDVAADETPLDGLAERAAQDGAGVPDRLGGEALLTQVEHPAGDVV